MVEAAVVWRDPLLRDMAPARASNYLEWVTFSNLKRSLPRATRLSERRALRAGAVCVIEAVFKLPVRRPAVELDIRNLTLYLALYGPLHRNLHLQRVRLLCKRKGYAGRASTDRLRTEFGVIVTTRSGLPACQYDSRWVHGADAAYRNPSVDV